jgi:N-acetylmuramoyl-L-alanine amidase
MKHVWLLDPGHGGFIDGEYQTAPAKMYRHSPEEVFYEGMFNRRIKDLLMRKLWEENIHHIDICPTDLDVPLTARVDVVNSYYKAYDNAVLISLHSNAGGGTGFEVWTSKGQTRSDRFAELLGQELQDGFRDIPFRADKTDGDLDKESDFYILEKTYCPAILPECLFFDNYNDYLLLQNSDFQNAYCKTLINFMKKAEQANL